MYTAVPWYQYGLFTGTSTYQYGIKFLSSKRAAPSTNSAITMRGKTPTLPVLACCWLAAAAAVADGNDERTTSDLSESLRRRGETRTYHAYVAKQQSKLALYPEKIRAIDVARQHQVRREFASAVARGTAGVAGFGGRTVLCLGARLGGEVRAFKSLGAVAVGIDLEPGRGNMDVVFGDFHDVPFAADSFDYAYSNVLDHIYDLRRFGREVARVVKPGGLFFASLYPGASVGGADAWTAKQAASLDDRPAFVAAMRACGFEEVDETRITEDMDLSSVMPPGARNAIWHQKILTIYLRRRS